MQHESPIDISTLVRNFEELKADAVQTLDSYLRSGDESEPGVAPVVPSQSPLKFPARDLGGLAAVVASAGLAAARVAASAEARAEPPPPLCCLSCGSESPPEARFCANCGQPIHRVSGQSATPRAAVRSPAQATRSEVFRVLTGDNAGQSIHVDPPARIGRDADNDVKLTDPEASRRHALIEIQDGNLVVSDLGSSNGTWVDERRIAGPTILSPGNQLRIGDTIFELLPVISTPAQPPAIRLVTTGGRGSGKTYAIGERSTLGRANDVEVLIPDPEVSHHHAVIEKGPHGYVLTDLGSRNGTFINDLPVRQPFRLKPGDTIRMGDTRLMVVLE